MKTENLTHGSYKAVREAFVIFRAFAKKGKDLYSAKSENSVNFHFVRLAFAKKQIGRNQDRDGHIPTQFCRYHGRAP